MYRIGVIGLGKIARDRHLPTLAADPDFELVAVADLSADLADLSVPGFRSHHEMLASVAQMDTVAICTPPNVRDRIALDALNAGRHILLEKPPAASVAGLLAVRDRADRCGKVLFTAWHSQHNQAVDEARRLLADAEITELQVTWKEDVRKWHPGQRWIWQAGGFGVFDPGINALSILTRIMPGRLVVRGAALHIPENTQTPIAAQMRFWNRRTCRRWVRRFRLAVERRRCS